LTATQLQESAVYLSLKYIAILLQSNPSIEGAEGSEYRLFIVALMLGKCTVTKDFTIINSLI
jgi:hypothetical protein